MSHGIQLDLVISGFESDASEISSLLGLKPSRTWKRGEPIQETLIIHKQNGWALSSGLGKNKPFQEHLEAIIRKVENVAQRFKDLPTNAEVEVSCAVWLQDDDAESLPAVHLDLRSMQFLGKIRAEIDLDLYISPQQ